MTNSAARTAVTLLAWACLQAFATSQPQRLSEPAAGTISAEFHHLHLMGAGQQLDFYEQLFPPTAIVRGTFWGAQGLRGDDVFLLWSPVTAPRQVASTAVWHFGWGKTATGESYRDHLLEGVNWKPPYPSLTTELHIHVRSRDPEAAAAWYETVLGGTREHRGPPAASNQPASSQPASEGRAEALVRLGKILLVIHRTDIEIASTRIGGSIDHIGFTVPDLAATEAIAKVRGIPIVERRYELQDIPTLMLEGPDRIVLEFLERPKGPAFWHDRP